MQGKILGSRYRIIEYIAKGGFGKTYLAEDMQLPHKDKCVVKQLYPSVNDPNFLQLARRLFKTEAETLNTLGLHDRIPQLLAYFEEDEKFYLVQQYIEGHPLSQELVSGVIWSEAAVIELLQDCLNILDFIHSKGVIHRDVKPDNLIRRQADNKLVLVDFGTVKEVIAEQTQLIPTTVAVGTRGYMPTEQAHGKPRITSDIYALGIVAIQALTGTHPIKLQETKKGEIIWQDKAQCSPQLIEIVSKMTRHHASERYQSARENLAALADLSNPSAVTIPPIEPVQTPYTPTLPYSPTAPLSDSQIADLSRTSPDTASTASDSSLNSDRLILNAPDRAANVAPNPTGLPAETPPEPAQPSRLTDRPHAPEHPINLRSNRSNTQKSKTLSALGIALVIGAIASGVMYFLNQEPNGTVKNSTDEPDGHSHELVETPEQQQELEPGANNAIAEPDGHSHELVENLEQQQELEPGANNAIAEPDGHSHELVENPEQQQEPDKTEQNISETPEPSDEAIDKPEEQSCDNLDLAVTTNFQDEDEQQQEFIAQCGLAKAQAEAANQQYDAALAIATTLPRNTAIETEIQPEVDSWSEQLLAQATELYQQEGNLAAAIEMVQPIPEDSSIKTQANEAVNAWEADYQTNEATLAIAEQALSEKQWQEAKEEATKVLESSSMYWQEKAEVIISQAEAGIAKTSPEEVATPPTPEIKEDSIPAFQSSPEEPLRDLDDNSESLPDTPSNSSPQNNTPLRDL